MASRRNRRVSSRRSGGRAGAAGGASGVGAFDPRAAAEWTFYYDQLVLWQYYCARNLLNNEETGLLETNLPTPTPAPGLTSAQPTPLPAEPVSSIDIASTIRPGETGKEPIKVLQYQTNPEVGGVSGASYGGGRSFMSRDIIRGPGQFGRQSRSVGGSYRASGARGRAGAGGPEAAVRVVFNPEEDYNNPDRNLAYRKEFLKAVENKEQNIYKLFMDMITRIDQREINQERYQDWENNKRQELINFAESWRKVEEGDTFMVKDNLYLVTQEPLDSVPINGVNIVRGERLTPQDILEEDGSLKQPKVD